MRRFVPGFMKPALRKINSAMIDLHDLAKGRDSMTPPRSMIFVGPGDFKAVGQEFKRHFIELGGIQPDDRILDVGCGIGRMAVPLTDYLSGKGEYCGIDIVKSGIEWCQRHIFAKFDNFHFLHINVKNKAYNADGNISAREFRFPFDDDSFDFVFLTSVFTHMLPADMEHYLSEISRVLKKDAKCLITFFLLNEESMHLVQAGRSTLDFKHKIDGCFTTDENNPESAIAYNEDYIRQLFGRLNLKLADPVNYGSWCKRDIYLSYQDIVVATKE